MADNRCVLLFVKFPERGKVKSRLAQHMDGDAVLRLYECMVLDTIDMLKQAGEPFRIFFDPPEAHERMRQWLGQEYTYLPQTGEDLGERMEKAFGHVFSEGVDEALLIGSDIPELTDALVKEAFQSFATHDVVIGPANDGGYYLVGFKKSTFYPEIFYNMEWSTGMVFRQTVERFLNSSIVMHLLPECTDIDTREDLEAVLSRAHSSTAKASRTFSFLRSCRDCITKNTC
jgi:rSAM/selenodomain-associated transferase 1